MNYDYITNREYKVMIGNKFINKLIQENGLTQEKISEKSGVKQQTISRLKIGQSKSPSFETAKKLSIAFDVDIAEIYK
tara:strand:- start:148 stop:381 length:234 start_codon:yes stop_codon:yes gene_type:complete